MYLDFIQFTIHVAWQCKQSLYFKQSLFCLLESALLNKQKKGSPHRVYTCINYLHGHIANLFLHVFKIGIPGSDCEKQVKQRQEKTTSL